MILKVMLTHDPLANIRLKPSIDTLIELKVRKESIYEIAK